MVKFIVQALPSSTTQTHFFVSVKHFTLKKLQKIHCSFYFFCEVFKWLSNKIRHTHTVLTDSYLNRYSGLTWSKFIEYPTVLPVLYVIVITNIEFVHVWLRIPRHEGEAQVSRVCELQYKPIIIGFIAQGHRHGGRFLFLVVVFFWWKWAAGKAGLLDDYTNMTHRVKTENVIFL